MATRDGVLVRAVRVLDCFSPQAQEMTLDELADSTGLPRSTVHRLTHQLAAEGMLEPTRRGWRLGTRLFELGQLVPTQQLLRELALPHMGDLYEVTHQTIQLAVLDNSEVLYVEVLAGHGRVDTPSRRGGRMPAHCTAVGKALLAFCGEEPAERLHLERRTARTITDSSELRTALHEVRREGLAYDREESLAGLACVAAPVLASKGRATAAISVSMPVKSKSRPEDFSSAVRTAALALGRELNSRAGFTAATAGD